MGGFVVGWWLGGLWGVLFDGWYVVVVEYVEYGQWIDVEKVVGDQGYGNGVDFELVVVQL